MTSMPISIGSSKATVTVNPLDPAEVFVTPEGMTDFPRVRHLLPPEWAGAQLHRFEPNIGRCGTWVMRMDVPADHYPRIWGSEDSWGCYCTACEAYLSVRFALVMDAAMDEVA